MNTNQQLEKLRRYMIGQIGTAVVGHCAPIETYHTDENAEDTIDGLYESPLTIFLGSDYHNVIRLEDGEDGAPICLMDGEDGEDYPVAVDTLSTDTLQEIVGWLTEHGFITPTTPAPIPRTCEFGDFIQRHLPNHSVRYDVFRQSELQCFIDGHEAPDFGLTRDEAITERDRLLLRIYAETIDAFTRQKRQSFAENELEAYCETVAEIAYDAGAAHFHYSNDSRCRIEQIVYWAQEFHKLHEDTDWDEVGYLETLWTFIDQKFRKYQKPLDIPCPSCGHHSVKYEAQECGNEYYILVCGDCGYHINGNKAKELITKNKE